jgi:large subunit ribosomal protein L24e
MECSFCGRDIEKGTETVYVTNKGKASYFCSRKCEKNILKLGRKARKVKWTEEYRAEKSIRLRSIAPKPEEKKEKKHAAEEAPKEVAEKPKREKAAKAAETKEKPKAVKKPKKKAEEK